MNKHPKDAERWKKIVRSLAEVSVTVMADLASLGVNVLPVGVVGDDEPGTLLLEAFREKKISVAGIHRLKKHPTTTKTRILAGMSHTSRQQVVRVDREPEPLGELHPDLLNLINAAREYATASDGMLVSAFSITREPPPQPRMSPR